MKTILKNAYMGRGGTYRSEPMAANASMEILQSGMDSPR